MKIIKCALFLFMALSLSQVFADTPKTSNCTANGGTCAVSAPEGCCSRNCNAQPGSYTGTCQPTSKDFGNKDFGK